MLLAKVFSDNRDAESLKRFVRESLGQAEPVVSPLENKVGDALLDLTATIIARRLYKGDTEVTLLSSKDLLEMGPQLMELVREDNTEMTDDDAVIFLKAMESVIDNLVALTFDNLCGDEHPYDYYHRWFEVVLTYADELNCAPEDLFSMESCQDEVTRRIYTKEQLRENFRRRQLKYTPETLIKTIINPMLNAFGDDEEDRAFAEMMRAQLEPGIRANFEKTQPLFKIWFETCLKRVFPN